MLTEQAIVLDYQQGIAKVRCQAQSLCGSCASKQGCGSSVLSELTGKGARGEHIFEVASLIPLRCGQRVEIGLQERTLISSALLIYCLPLFTLLIATFLSGIWLKAELLRALLIFCCTGITFWLVRIYADKLKQKPSYQPVLLRVIS